MLRAAAAEGWDAGIGGMTLPAKTSSPGARRVEGPLLAGLRSGGVQPQHHRRKATALVAIVTSMVLDFG